MKSGHSLWRSPLIPRPQATSDPTLFPNIIVKRSEIDRVTGRRWNRKLPGRVEDFVDSSPFFTSLLPRLERLVGELFDDESRTSSRHVMHMEPCPNEHNMALVTFSSCSFMYLSHGNLETPAKLFKEKIIYKRPGGTGYAPHYDGPSCALSGLAKNFITVGVSIDDQTPENGCLRGVWPKHQCPEEESCIVEAKPGASPDADGRAGAIDGQIAAELPWRDMPSKAGTITIFNHWFPHYSEPNHSSSTRRMAYFLFNSGRDGDLHDAHRDYAKRIREEYEQAERDREAEIEAMASFNLGTVLKVDQ